MTTPDLLPYIGVIERLIPLINTAEFNEVFGILTSELPKPKQFLLKMELKRLGQPCSYYIDLRGKVDGEVRSYEHGGRTHYMDDTAIKAFERGLKRYGRFTMGLYEEVMNTDNNYRVRHKHETEQRLQAVIAGETPAQTATEPAEPEVAKAGPALVQFASYSNRGEERMNFTIDIEIALENGELFPASTVDLSVSGSKLKIPGSRTMSAGQKIAITFKGLEQEFALGLNQGVPYQVIDTEIVDRAVYARVKRLPMTDEHGFSEFLRQFIQGNKRRYKVNLDNTLDAVVVKGYEQFYLPRISSLPVFLAVREGLPVPVCAMTTENNRQLVQYFQDEHQHSVLMQLLSGKRLKACLQKAPAERSCILYCFTHAAKGKLFFYSATSDELQQLPELQKVFFGFAARKPSFRVFHLVVHRTHPQHAHQLLSLPNSADHDISKLNQPPSQLIQNLIRDFRYIVSLTDITSEENIALYQQIRYDENLLSQLKIFGHAKVDQLPPLEAVALQYVNLRGETRYLYKTKVLLLAAEQPLEAHTRDFSSKGLQIEAAQQVSFQKGDRIQLALPEMQKISSKFDLQQLHYEVMAVSKSQLIMNLKVLEQEEPHQGRLFFEQLIKSNKDKLTPAEETPKYAGLGTVLRNMYVRALNSLPFYMHRHGIRYDLNVVGRGAEPNNLHYILGLSSAHNHKINLQPLLKNNATNLQFANQLKAMKRQDAPKVYEVFIRFSPATARSEASFVTEFDFELKTSQARQNFVQEAIQQDLLFCFKIYLSRTGRPDTDYIAKELGYVSLYAIHKAKVLEEELWSVVGVGDVIDISDEVLLRYSVSAAQINAQLQKRRQFIAALQQS